MNRVPREYVNNYFPQGSIHAEPGSTPQERSKFVQAGLDCMAVIGVFLFVGSTGFAIAFSFIALFFLSF